MYKTSELLWAHLRCRLGGVGAAAPQRELHSSRGLWCQHLCHRQLPLHVQTSSACNCCSACHRLEHCSCLDDSAFCKAGEANSTSRPSICTHRQLARTRHQVAKSMLPANVQHTWWQLCWHRVLQALVSVSSGSGNSWK